MAKNNSPEEQQKFEDFMAQAILLTAVQLNIDLQNCNTHGFPFTIDPVHACATIDLKEVTVIIEKRPVYCDRGRYGFWVEPKEQSIVSIDAQDGFPRYFFNLQRALDELKDWIDFNKDRI